MKGAYFSILAVPALFMGAFAAPASAPATAVVEKRQTSSAYSIVEALYSDIQQYTGSISSSQPAFPSTMTKVV